METTKQSSTGIEVDYLISVLRAILTESSIPAAPPELDWERWLSAVRFHGVAVYIMDKSSAVLSELVPKDVYSRLSALRKSLLIRNMFVCRSAVQLEASLRAAGIESFFIKGPILGVHCYGDSSGRVFSDLDLVVSKTQLLDTIQFLASKGFVPKQVGGTVPPLAAFSNALYLKVLHAYPFVNSDTGIEIDLHWRLFPSFDTPVQLEQCRRHLQTFTCPGGTLTGPDVNLQMLLSCFHTSDGLWCRLLWLLDIASMKRNANFSEKTCLEMTKALINHTEYYEICMYLTHKLFSADEKPEQLKDAASSLEATVMEWLRRSEHVKTTRREVLRIQQQLQPSKNLNRLVQAAFVPSHDQVAKLLVPPYLEPVHYVIRPFILVGGFLGRLLSMKKQPSQQTE